METLTLKLAPVAEQVVLDRRHLHAHPELAYQERETARLVAERLRAHGYQVRTGIAETGVVATLRGGRVPSGRGKTVLLRADMDALPIDEENDVPYKSTVPGVMHACGHDGHTAILLGAARVLAERREQLAGTVKLVFQPAEEGGAGGLRMVEAGVMDGPKVDAVFGLHLTSTLPAGTVSARPGAILAAADRFRIEVHGKGGHAARPHQSVDTVLAASQVVVALHHLVSREVDPLQPAVLTVGAIHAGEAPNVIPDRAELRGTVRTYDEALRQRMARRVEEVAAAAAGLLGATATTEYTFGYPATVNDAAMAEFVAEVARGVVGPERVVPSEPQMPADDMTYYLQRAPGCYFWVGTANEERGLTWPHHHPRYDLDEVALPVGVDVLVAATEAYLARGEA